MQFNLIANGELIGYSELEGADPSIGVRIARFVPMRIMPSPQLECCSSTLSFGLSDHRRLPAKDAPLLVLKKKTLGESYAIAAAEQSLAADGAIAMLLK